jgi:F-type H+-transporting ATPase subunit a
VNIRVFGDPKVFEIGPVPITETMLTSLGVSVVLVMLAALFRFAVIHQPDSTIAALAKLTVNWLDNTVREILGRPEPAIATLTGSFFIFIAACNISGQFPGVHPATASLATTSALAIVVLLAVPVAGIRVRGFWGYVKHYFSPNPMLFPLHLVSEFSRTVALAMRLFGNIMSGHLVVGLMVALSGFLVPMPFMALDLLIGLLQAYIFAVLSTVFIGAAIGAGEKAWKA